MTIDQLEARVRMLEIALASQDAQREPDDWETVLPQDAAASPPGPAQAIPPAVGVGAIGTKFGAYALEDHTHDADAAPDPDELLPAPCPDYGGILRSHKEGVADPAWERRCLIDNAYLYLPFGRAGEVDWDEVEELEVGFIDEAADPSPEWVVREFVVRPAGS